MVAVMGVALELSAGERALELGPGSRGNREAHHESRLVPATGRAIQQERQAP
jgi:hypothetical protein